MGSDESGDFFRLLCAELDGALEAAASSDAESSSAAPAVRGSRSSAPVRPEFPGDGDDAHVVGRDGLGSAEHAKHLGTLAGRASSGGSLGAPMLVTRS